jgi:hypothetical protein
MPREGYDAGTGLRPTLLAEEALDHVEVWVAELLLAAAREGAADDGRDAI